jgi:putative acetyltransferase
VSHELEVLSARDADVVGLMSALTADLAGEGYGPEETFGYSVEQLEVRGVHLVGVRVDGALVGLGGIELQGDGIAELKRFYVVPAHRNRGVADAVLTALLTHAADHGVVTVRLETGDKQGAAIAFYARHGFAEVPRFAPYENSATSVCMQRPL